MNIKYLQFTLMISAIILICGCNPDLPKTVDQTDEKAYKIIDSTWSDSQLDQQNDYKITDDSSLVTTEEIKKLSQ